MNQSSNDPNTECYQKLVKAAKIQIETNHFVGDVLRSTQTNGGGRRRRRRGEEENPTYHAFRRGTRRIARSPLNPCNLPLVGIFCGVLGVFICMFVLFPIHLVATEIMNGGSATSTQDLDLASWKLFLKKATQANISEKSFENATEIHTHPDIIRVCAMLNNDERINNVLRLLADELETSFTIASSELNDTQKSLFKVIIENAKKTNEISNIDDLFKGTDGSVISYGIEIDKIIDAYKAKISDIIDDGTERKLQTQHSLMQSPVRFKFGGRRKNKTKGKMTKRGTMKCRRKKRRRTKRRRTKRRK